MSFEVNPLDPNVPFLYPLYGFLFRGGQKKDALGTNGITIKTAVILDNIKQILIDTFETLPIYWVKAHSPNIYLFKVNNKNSIK